MDDLIIIGAGSGGLAAAKRAAAAGKSVTLIENDSIGGTCVTYGCVPKKLWHAISQFKHQAVVAKHHGWSMNEPSFDWGSVQPRLNKFIQSLNDRHEQKCLDFGITIIRGTAKFHSPNEILVNGEIRSAKHILIAVGSKAVRLDIPGAQYCDTSYEFFSWQSMPKSVLVWGGGYIAVELAAILNALGADVHIVIRQPWVLRGFDEDMRQFLQGRYIDRGMTIHPNTTIESISKDDKGLQVHCANGEEINVEKIIQAVGREPNTGNLSGDAIGIKQADNGAIIVNDQYQTSVSSISAIGDCIDQVQLTPVAIAQAREWVDTVLLKKSFPVDYSLIPTAIFSHPEAASIGLSENDARQKYTDITTKKLSFNPLTLALAESAKEPVFMKLILEGQEERVVGIHLVCESAAEIMQSLAIAMQKGITKTDFDLTMALHPSIMEELVTIY